MNIKKEAGFTLPEVIIVLAIITCLLTMYAFNGKWIQVFGEKSVDQQNTAALGALVSQYKMQQGKYPETLNDLTKNSTYGAYIMKLPKDSHENDFNYAYSSIGFAIWSNGENGQNDSGNGVPLQFQNDDVGILGL